MKKFFLFIFLISLSGQMICGKFSFGDHWYDNPLGFKPIELHTRNGFLLPALAVGVCLLATQADTTLTNRLSFYNESGISWGYKYPYTALFQNNTGVQYYLRRWMSVGVDIGFYFPRDNFNNTAGAAIRPFARFYPINNECWRLYLESGDGFVYFKDA